MTGQTAVSGASVGSQQPDLGTEPLPVEPYVSADFFELEKRHVFKKTWLHVGRVEEIPGVGDYFVKDLPACDASVIVVRNKRGEVRAFHNVCSHRLNKVVYEGRGCARKLFCKFHGWAYDLDGNLTGVPEEDAFPGLDKARHGLTPVSCDTWRGFIFINMDPTPALTLAEFIDPLFADIADYPFEKLTSCFSWNAVVNCNWKVALDAFQETYHVAYVHGRSIADALKKDEAGNLRPLGGQIGEYHRRLSIGGNPESVYGNPKAVSEADGAESAAGGAEGRRPIAAAAMRHGAGGLASAPSLDELPAGLNWTEDPDWAFDINVFFPEFYLSVRPNYVQAYNFRPLTHNRTLLEARVYYPKAKTVGGRFYQEYMKCALRDVLLEDCGTLEHTQSASETGAKSEILLHDCEVMLRHSAQVVERLIAEGEAFRRAAE